MQSYNHIEASRVGSIVSFKASRRIHSPTVHTHLLYSPVGLDLKLAKRALKDSLK